MATTLGNSAVIGIGAPIITWNCSSWTRIAPSAKSRNPRSLTVLKVLIVIAFIPSGAMSAA